MLYLRWFYMIWVFGIVVVVMIALSNTLFSRTPFSERLRRLGISLLLAPVWPLAMLTAPGRRRLFGALHTPY